jgi:hypothetical protein
MRWVIRTKESAKIGFDAAIFLANAGLGQRVRLAVSEQNSTVCASSQEDTSLEPLRVGSGDDFKLTHHDVQPRRANSDPET